MSGPWHRVEPAWRYDAAGEAAFALEALLQSHGITIHPGSAMETHVLDVMRLVDEKATHAAPSNDVRDQYRTLVGVHDLATAILEVRDSRSFSSLLPHLRLLSTGHALQNSLSSPTDQVTNKLFELLAATAAMQCGEDVELDNPTAAQGNNPDVLATLGGRRWGIACKVLHSVHPEGLIGHLEKGLDQIERSQAEIGLVLFSLKNTLPHDDIWPMGEVEDAPGTFATGCWSEPAAPFDILFRHLDEISESLSAHLLPGYLESTFAGKKSIPGFLLWAPSVSAVLIDGRPTPTNVRALNFRELAPVDTQVTRVLKCLDWAMLVGSRDRGKRPTC